MEEGLWVKVLHRVGGKSNKLVKTWRMALENWKENGARYQDTGPGLMCLHFQCEVFYIHSVCLGNIQKRRKKISTCKSLSLVNWNYKKKNICWSEIQWASNFPTVCWQQLTPSSTLFEYRTPTAKSGIWPQRGGFYCWHPPPPHLALFQGKGVPCCSHFQWDAP